MLDVKLYEGLFQKGTNYKETFAEEVQKLDVQRLTVEFKCWIVKQLVESYFDQVGEYPDSFQLTELADWILLEYENEPDKVTNTEYPVLSKRQLMRRQIREFSNDEVEKWSSSGKHKINGKRKPKRFMVFGEYQ